MYDTTTNLSRQEIECFEMFQMFDKGAYDLMMKINIKRWEYVLYGGKRPELYPQDKKALFAMIKFKEDRLGNEKKRIAKQQEMKQKRTQILGGGGRSL
jgi:hypothetical protein